MTVVKTRMPETAFFYGALVIPGGRAPEYLRLNPKTISLTQEFSRANKPIAAICHGPQTLVAAGALKGRTSTCCIAVTPDMVARAPNGAM